VSASREDASVDLDGELNARKGDVKTVVTKAKVTALVSLWVIMGKFLGLKDG
jgi:hypothetical protein